MRRVIQNGLLSGFAGGVALALYMLVFGRGPIKDALDYEETLAHAGGDHGTAHDELFSRGVQEVGGALGLLIFGIALGVIFAIVLASFGPRLGAVSPMQASLRLGLAGFIVVVAIPFLKYPANPPSVGDPDTINERTVMYFAVLILSIVLANTVWQVVQHARQPAITRAWLGAGLYAAGLMVIFIALPDPADPVTAPTDLVWRFRMASIGGLAAAWAAMSLVMGSLLTRQTAGDASDSAVVPAYR